MSKSIEPRDEYLEMWNFQLSPGQKGALALACQGQNIRRSVSNISGELHWKSYDKITRLGLLRDGRITDKGRAVYEAGQALASTPAPPFPDPMVESYELVSENADELENKDKRIAELEAVIRVCRTDAIHGIKNGTSLVMTRVLGRIRERADEVLGDLVG